MEAKTNRNVMNKVWKLISKQKAVIAFLILLLIVAVSKQRGLSLFHA